MSMSLKNVVAQQPTNVKQNAKKDSNIRTTKQGNTYYHTNAGKKVGTGLAMAASTATAAALGAMTKSTRVAGFTLGMTLLKTLPLGLGGGAIVDAFLNHHEKKKADKLASYKA